MSVSIIVGRERRAFTRACALPAESELWRGGSVAQSFNGGVARRQPWFEMLRKHTVLLRVALVCGSSVSGTSLLGTKTGGRQRLTRLCECTRTVVCSCGVCVCVCLWGS